MLLEKLNIIYLTTIFIFSSFVSSELCDETVCRSIVSKCQLLQKCNCELGNSTCSVQCFKCLDYLDIKCCSCVSICPTVRENSEPLSAKSHVEDLIEPMPTLFNTLTEEGDHLNRWSAYTFPVKMSFILFPDDSSAVMRQIEFRPGKKITTKSDGLDEEEDIEVNCTVAFMSKCIPLNKCKSSCTSMGASSYRWFHDGCCQCVGANCINYGVNQSKCNQCSVDENNLISSSSNYNNVDEINKNELITSEVSETTTVTL